MNLLIVEFTVADQIPNYRLRAQNFTILGPKIPKYRITILRGVMVFWSLAISAFWYFWPFCIFGLRDLIGVVRIGAYSWRKIPKYRITVVCAQWYFGNFVFRYFCILAILYCNRALRVLVFSAVFWPFCILGLRDLTGVVRFGGRAQNTEIPNYRCARVMVFWSLGISVFWYFGHSVFWD